MKKNAPSPQTNTTSDDSAIATAPKRVTVATIDDDALFVAVQEIPEEELEDVHVRELPPEPRLRRAWCYRDGAWLRRAALVGSDGRYLRIDEVPPDKLSSLHLPQIVDCDLDPSLGYKWQQDPKNPFGGHFVPPPRKTPEQKFADSEPLPALALFFKICRFGAAARAGAVLYPHLEAQGIRAAGADLRVAQMVRADRRLQVVPRNDPGGAGVRALPRR